MEINGVTIDNEFAEAFPTWVCRVIITAVTTEWARKAATEATGFATSAIGCPCEAGIEQELDGSQTPDGRPGVSILISLSAYSLHQRLQFLTGLPTLKRRSR
jgi:formylmethanofuran--tetrahydromethanopterin N-formyltransferase